MSKKIIYIFFIINLIIINMKLYTEEKQAIREIYLTRYIDNKTEYELVRVDYDENWRIKESRIYYSKGKDFKKMKEEEINDEKKFFAGYRYRYKELEDGKILAEITKYRDRYRDYTEEKKIFDIEYNQTGLPTDIKAYSREQYAFQDDIYKELKIGYDENNLINEVDVSFSNEIIVDDFYVPISIMRRIFHVAPYSKGIYGYKNEMKDNKIYKIYEHSSHWKTDKYLEDVEYMYDEKGRVKKILNSNLYVVYDYIYENNKIIIFVYDDIKGKGITDCRKYILHLNKEGDIEKREEYLDGKFISRKYYDKNNFDSEKIKYDIEYSIEYIYYNKKIKHYEGLLSEIHYFIYEGLYEDISNWKDYIYEWR